MSNISTPALNLISLDENSDFRHINGFTILSKMLMS